MIDLDELERLYEAATPGEWGLCNDGKCKCMLLSGEDYPIATFEDGEWGDTYPAIRYSDGRGLSGTTVEAYMEIIPYGALPEGMGTANLRLTATLHNTAPDLIARIRELEAESDARYLENKRMRIYLSVLSDRENYIMVNDRVKINYEEDWTMSPWDYARRAQEESEG